MKNKWYGIHMGPAKMALDLGDGSERAEYVSQDYILNVLGRPHRNINLMYTYYPNDVQWPQRISEACKDMEINYQWDYPYDDYFPYGVNGEPFESMKDIRKHGQDVTLTLTIDCSLSDERLRKIAADLKPYGRMKLRINHECAGDWFTHNRRFSYKEVADFFVRFTKIIKEEAPNIETIFCAGFSQGKNMPVDHEEDFKEAYQAADNWSADCYLALHYGWPYDIAEKGSGRYNFSTVDNYYNLFKNTAARLTEITGCKKPMITAEFNTDGDVTGPRHQGESVKRFYEKFRDEGADWFKAVTFYQFRDRGRLGLEMEDGNNKSVGIAQPIMKEYKELLADPYFMPKMKHLEETGFPYGFRWGGAEDADGLATLIHFENAPEFCEVSFEDEIGLMMEINGKWFYKAPHNKTMDLMPAFFDNMPDGEKDIEFKIFATPDNGVNEKGTSEDWNMNFYKELVHEPEFRIRYEPVETVK